MYRTKSNDPLNLTRRNILAGGSALVVVAVAQWPSHAVAASIDTDAFLQLSQNLTRKQGLSADIAAPMLEAFDAIGKGEEIAALINGGANPELTNNIVAAWYSGASPDPDSEEVVTYLDALMWQAMSYTKPMGVCGGATGYWADPPAN